MIIVLHGENSFFTKRKQSEIVAQYRAKHPHALSLYFFESNCDFAEFKAATETTSLFDPKKLVVVKNALDELKGNAGFFTFLKEKDIKEDKNTVVLFTEDKIVEMGPVKARVGAKRISSTQGADKNKQLAWLLEKPTVVQESKQLSSSQLSEWVRQEIMRLGGEADADAIPALIASCGTDLWRLASECAKLVSYAERVTKQNITCLVSSEAHGQIFEALAALTAGNAKGALSQFSALIKEGEDWMKLFGMIVFQFRSIAKVRSLLDEGADAARIQKVTGMKPFTIQKIMPYAKARTMEQIKQTYKKLVDADLALKTGRTSFEVVVENLVLGL